MSKINQIDSVDNNATFIEPEVLHPAVVEKKPGLKPEIKKPTTVISEEKEPEATIVEKSKILSDEKIHNIDNTKKQTKIEKKIDSNKMKMESKDQTTNKKVDNKITVTKNSSKESSGIKKSINNKIAKKKESIKPNEVDTANTEKITEEKMTINPGFGINYLIKKYWFSKNKPIAFLPSSLNSCVTKNSKLICNSQVMEEERFGSVISFKVKSIITKDENSADRFLITYRNLILDVKDTEVTTIKTAPVKIGWSKKNKVDCEYTGNETISCVKNNVHKIEINGKDR